MAGIHLTVDTRLDLRILSRDHYTLPKHAFFQMAEHSDACAQCSNSHYSSPCNPLYDNSRKLMRTAECKCKLQSSTHTIHHSCSFFPVLDSNLLRTSFIMSSVSRIYCAEWQDDWWIMNLWGLGKKQLCPKKSAILVFVWSDWGKLWKHFGQDSWCPSWDSNQGTPE
jgi:hypothetical protein